jgi:hypothetical protein
VSTAGVAGRLKPWLIPYAVVGAAAIAFMIFGRRLRPGPRSRVLCGFVVADLVIFSVLAVVAVDAGLGRGTGKPASSGASAASEILPGKPAARPSAQASAARPVAALGYGGRFAIYDPNQIDARQLPVIGSPDLNSISGTPSVQGYTSIVDGRYASATGSHQAMGEGQDELSAQAVGSGVLGQLDTSVLLTVPAYLITAPGSVAPPGPSGTGGRAVAAHARATWYLGMAITVSSLSLPDADARQAAAAGLRIGLMTPGGSTRWFGVRAASASLLTADLPDPVPSVAVIGQAGSRPARLGAPSVTGPHGTVFVADGQLQDVLTPPQWGLGGNDGSFAVFVDRAATGMLSLQALAGRSTSGAAVRQVSGPAAEPAAAAVRSPHGVRVVRSVAAIPGWTATWYPASGKPVPLAISRAGLVQAVDVPPGQGILTWSYVSPGFRAAFALSLGAAALLLLLLIAACRWSPLRLLRPRRRPAGEGLLADLPGQRETAGFS